MNERDLETRLRDAYRSQADTLDPGALSERVHSIPATVEPQRRRWWQRFRSGATRHAGLGGAQVRGANNMLAAARVAAIVAALALGTTFLAVQIGEPDGEVGQPLSEAPGEAWVTVTGTQSMFGGSVEDALLGRNVDMSDPRVEGDVRITYDHGMSAVDDSGLNSTIFSVVTITNDGGSWHGPSIGFVDGKGVHHHFGWLEGSGEYEGLVFLEQLTEELASAGMELEIAGLVYEGDLPPLVLPAPIVD